MKTVLSLILVCAAFVFTNADFVEDYVVGDYVEDFSLENIDGKMVSMANYNFPCEIRRLIDLAPMSANNRWIHGESSHFAAGFISFCGRCGILNNFAMRLGYFLHLFAFSCSSRRTSCMSMAAKRSARSLLPLSKMAR